MNQKIETIEIEHLVLWTENPRDPINPDATDQDIVNKAILDNGAKWMLIKLAKEMGGFYDFSELPTVVYKNGKPIVYDGNRRIILAKIKHGLVSIGDFKIKVPEIPHNVPCNVCSEDVALQNVYRKHADSGSWNPLERDLFLHKYMHEAKSPFLLFEENTKGFISSHPVMNQRFVKEEILNERWLKALGFSFNGELLLTLHNKEELRIILEDLLNKVDSKALSTRKNRGKVIDILDTRSQKIITKNKNANPRPVYDICNGLDAIPPSPHTTSRRTRRTMGSSLELFGGKLYLQSGNVNNLYRDIDEIHSYYITNKEKFSNSFVAIIRMSLRLLCESAARDLFETKSTKDTRQMMDKYIAQYFDLAKKELGQDELTFLSGLNVNKGSLLQLLHTGAHDYAAARIYEQTIAISIILGGMLKLSHEK